MLDYITAGVDIGSTTAKAVVIGNGKVFYSKILPTGTDPVSVCEITIGGQNETSDEF